MILLRIPGLREVLRLLYAIKMLERTLRLGSLGKVTAVGALLIYLVNIVNWLLRREKVLTARQKQLEAEIDLRTISIEDALRGYKNIPERFRGEIPP